MSRAQTLITENIATWTGAIQAKSTAGRGSSNKYELYGIKKLRELILELAVRGKLVPQDSSDEPASVLLDRIAAEKSELIKQGKIKKPKALPPVSDDEKPFELPVGWVWGRFGTVTFNRDAERIPLSSSERANRIGQYDYYGASGVIDHIDDYLFDKPLLLIGEDGANLINRSTPIAFIASGKYWVNNHAHVIDGISEDFLKYIATYINSISLVPYITGTAQPKMNQAKMNTIPLAIPPVEEQIRILIKVDELMALCDQLEQQTESSIEAHATLVDTLLATLSNSTDADELQQNWARIAEHFDTLFTTEQSMDALKQTILQLAVMGKLVRQNPEDEPAAVLLKRIAAEKDRLVKEKKLKKEKALADVNDNEMLFELPAGWNWCRLDALSLSSEAGWSPQCEPTPREGDNWGVLKVSAVTWGSFNPEENKALPKGMSPRTQYEVKHGDFLISRANTAELVARAVVVPADTPSHLMMSDKIIRFTFSTYVVSEYINLVNSCNYSREYYATVAGGTSSSMKNVSRNQIRDLVIPLPPFNEQHRIIAKVDELMTLCEQLKDKLRQSQRNQVHLTDAIIEQTLGQGGGV